MAKNYLLKLSTVRLGIVGALPLPEIIRYLRNEEALAYYHAKSPEKKAASAEKAKLWRDADPERQKKYKKNWVAKNPEKFRAIRRNNHLKKKKCPTQKLNRGMRKAMKQWLFRTAKASGRVGSLQARLGYSAADLRSHLERQFQKGMSWDNYGEWHIDHIVPLASFRISGLSDPEFKAAWALTNLRPLWGAENIQKGARRLYLL